MKQITDDQFKQYQAMAKAAGICIPEPQQGAKWTPKKQPYRFSCNGEVYNEPTELMTKYGMARSTVALCKIASDRTIRANRISAWLDEFGSGEQEFTGSEDYCFIFCDTVGWCYSSSKAFYPDVVYMLKEDAIKLCDALNNGSVEL